MAETATQTGDEGRAFRRKLIWFVAIKVIVLALTGVVIAYYIL